MFDLVVFVGAQDQKVTEVYQEKEVSLAFQVHRVLQVQSPLMSENEVTFFTCTIKVSGPYHLPNLPLYSNLAVNCCRWPQTIT